MKALRRLSYSRRPSSTNVTISPSAAAHPWEEDRHKVLSVGASFSVKYLASKEVSQPRGVRVCENAVKATPYRKGKKRMTLTISKGGIRIVDDTTKMLAVDQPINKISFCSPDAYNPRIFSYIARDGVTRRWICHVFVAAKGLTGERLSHALGCAFAACLADKQKTEGKEKKTDNTTAAQLENMLKDSVPPGSQQQNLEWLRKQHQTRKQVSSSPSPPHSSASSSPEFQSRTVEGWQEKAETTSFEEELDNMLKNNSILQKPHSLSPSPPASLGSDSYQLDFSAVTSSPLKESLSDSFLPSYTTASKKQTTNSNRRTSVSPTNDPWQSVPKTSVTDVPDGAMPFTSSPVKDSAWIPFNTSPVPAVQQESDSRVTLDPWSSNANKISTNPAPKRKSTNPWASDVSEVNIAQSVAPTKTASSKPQQNDDAFQFDPLQSDWTRDDEKFNQPKRDSSDLFGNWDVAVKQMHQMPSYNAAPHMYHNAWPQQTSNGQMFTTPSLI